MAASVTGDCRALYGNVKIVGEAGWAHDGAVYDGPFDLKKLLIRNICHQAIFYRADLLRIVDGFNRDYIVAQTGILICGAGHRRNSSTST